MWFKCSPHVQQRAQTKGIRRWGIFFCETSEELSLPLGRTQVRILTFFGLRDDSRDQVLTSSVELREVKNKLEDSTWRYVSSTPTKS